MSCKLYSTKVDPNLVHKGLVECVFATVKHNTVLEHRRVRKIRESSPINPDQKHCKNNHLSNMLFLGWFDPSKKFQPILLPTQ